MVVHNRALGCSRSGLSDLYRDQSECLAGQNSPSPAAAHQTQFKEGRIFPRPPYRIEIRMRRSPGGDIRERFYVEIVFMEWSGIAMKNIWFMIRSKSHTQVTKLYPCNWHT